LIRLLIVKAEFEIAIDDSGDFAKYLIIKRPLKRPFFNRTQREWVNSDITELELFQQQVHQLVPHQQMKKLIPLEQLLALELGQLLAVQQR
jgi:hypothetical protein